MKPGALGFDPLKLSPADPTAFEAMQNKELNNGRTLKRRFERGASPRSASRLLPSCFMAATALLTHPGHLLLVWCAQVWR